MPQSQHPRPGPPSTARDQHRNDQHRNDQHRNDQHRHDQYGRDRYLQETDSLVQRRSDGTGALDGAALLSDDADISAILSERTTGGGLHMVNALGEVWGVASGVTGKTVWAVVGGSVPTAQGSPELAQPAHWGSPTGKPVLLAAIPVRLAVESDINVDMVVRVRTSQIAVMRTPLERDLLFPAFEANGLVENDALACVPLCRDGQALGCVAISFRRTRDFNPSDLELLRQLAEATATAL